MGRVENIVGKGENTGFLAFSPFPTMFSEGFLYRIVKKLWLCDKELRQAFLQHNTNFTLFFFLKELHWCLPEFCWQFSISQIELCCGILNLEHNGSEKDVQPHSWLARTI